MRFSTAILLALPLSGCAVARQADTPPPAPILCKAGADCATKWSRAVSWVTTNSRYKLQTQTDSVIQTMGPTTDSLDPAYTVTKLARDAATFEITFTGGCDNFICDPSIPAARAKFAAFVNGG